jgi:type IV pilus assembly protein PilB
MIEASDARADLKIESPLAAAITELETSLSESAAHQDLNESVDEEPIVRYVNLVIFQAIKEKASDIHFEPFEDEFRIRYRIDGVLYDLLSPPAYLILPIISRVKILAGMNITERRIPQDGHFKFTVTEGAVDFRASTLPVQFGESLVLRVLDKSNVNLNLDELGIPGALLRKVRKTIERPNGIFIITGPTGCGKTTTLYSALREINHSKYKILTAEDPVEYQLDGLIQVTINPDVGLTFAQALRSFLRQDPDKIMVGEIRDLETARIAVQAAFTGHLVFSTLHTIDSVGAITRFVDLGIEPYLVAASLECVMAQRLIRCICPACRSAYSPGIKNIALLSLSLNAATDQVFSCGTGCAHCYGTGYSGRTGIFELLVTSDMMRELIVKNKSTQELRRQAVSEGLTMLREVGIRAILDGVTTVEEVLAAT